MKNMKGKIITTIVIAILVLQSNMYQIKATSTTDLQNQQNQNNEKIKETEKELEEIKEEKSEQ